MMTLPKKSESPRITTWFLSEVKLFAEWCTTHQVFQLDNVQAWSVINQCFDQDVMTTMETLVCGRRRRTEKLQRRPLQKLTLKKSYDAYGRALQTQGRPTTRPSTWRATVYSTPAYIPITWTEGIAMQKKVREVMDACPPEIYSDISTVRDEVKNWASSP